MSDIRSSAAIRASLKGYEPTDEQWVAIAHPLEPAYLVAGAGSGKTAVMAARIVWAIENAGFPPVQILGLTFTNKAAEELQDRVRTALAESTEHRPEDITVQTYNAFAAGIVREHGLLVDVEAEAGLLSEAQQWQLVLSCVDEVPPFRAIELRSPGGIVRATLDMASQLADHIKSVGDVAAANDRLLGSRDVGEDIIKTAQQRQELLHVVDAYIKAKRRAGRIDFGDQISKAVEILVANKEVRESYAKRYPVILLDEYQDTNVAQRKMIQELFRMGSLITAVGDSRQAIYAFRGATMYNLIGFARDFPRPDGQSYGAISLSENFRSGGRILEVANRVVEVIPEERRIGKPLRAQSANREGKVNLGLFADEQTEARFIVDEIEGLHGQPTLEGRDPVAWKDIAILVRRKATMDPIIDALEAKQIPFEVVGLGGLLKTPEVLEIVAWLRALDGRPSANRWLARILLGPRWRIHYRDLGLCAKWESERNHELRVRLAGGNEEAARDLAPGDVGYSLAEALEHVDEIDGLGPQAGRRLKAFGRRLHELRRIAHGPLIDIVQEVIRSSGIGDALDASAARTADASQQNVSNFLDHVAAFAPIAGEATLRSFLAYLDAADQAEETLEAMQPAEVDSVKLMTVHSAKGLEFEAVFIPAVAASEGKYGKVWSIFPDTRGSNPLESYRVLPYEVRDDRDYLPTWKGKLKDFKAAVKERSAEDERRLFYVALTRAKQRLYVSAAWWYNRDNRAKGPSEFWDELEPLVDEGLIELIEKADCPEENPVFDMLEGRRAWPPPARAVTDDELFPEGPGASAEAVVTGGTTIESLVAALPDDARAEFERAFGRSVEELTLIREATRDGKSEEAALPDVLSATGYVALQKGSLSAWDLIRPLPSRPTASRRIGTEVHRLIEERTRGIAPFPEETELDEPSEVTEPGWMGRLMTAWEGSPFPTRQIASLPSGEPMIELPFALRKDGRIIRGRIDAVYEMDDGGLEIVDFKTGRRDGYENLDETEADQLGLYAEALRAIGVIDSNTPVKLTYAFLDGEPPITRMWAGHSA